MKKQDFFFFFFFAVVTWGRAFWTIMDYPADYFLRWLIDCLVCENSENKEQCHRNNPELKLTPSLILFNSVNSKKHQNH